MQSRQILTFGGNQRVLKVQTSIDKCGKVRTFYVEELFEFNDNEIKSNGIANFRRVSPLGLVLRIARIQEKHAYRAFAEGLLGRKKLSVPIELL